MVSHTRRAMLVVALMGASILHGRASGLESDWAYAAKKLKTAGVHADFIEAVHKTYEPSDFAKVLELNTLLFLRKADYHGPQVSDTSATEVKSFVEGHKDDFTAIEQGDQVSPTVVASLIWMESRFGNNTGQFHVLSAFVDLVQADRSQSISYLREHAVPKFTAHLSRKERRKIASKAKQRARWAMGEIKALAQMWTRDHALVENLRGSFAGAFGMPQFEPSSYVRYARAKDEGAPNLSVPADAIRSVAYYLHRSGWRAQNLRSHRRALLKYNHSEDYARAILNLANRAETQMRAPSSTAVTASPPPRRRKRKASSPGQD